MGVFGEDRILKDHEPHVIKWHMKGEIKAELLG